MAHPPTPIPHILLPSSAAFKPRQSAWDLTPADCFPLNSQPAAGVLRDGEPVSWQYKEESGRREGSRERLCIDIFVSMVLGTHVQKCCCCALRFLKDLDLYLVCSYSSFVGVHYLQIRWKLRVHFYAFPEVTN